MARTRPYRPPFDARHEFVVTPPAGRPSLPVGGVMLQAGEQLDKQRVDPRRLRQMYEARLIAVAPGSVLPAAREKRPLAIGPVDAARPPAPPPASRPRSIPRRRLSRAAA